MRILRTIPVALALIAGPAALHAQAPTHRIEVVPQAGYAMFGDFWKGPVGTSIGNRNGALYGVQVGLNLTPALALTGNVAYSDGQLEAGLPVIGGAAFGSSETLYYDAGLQLRLPVATGNVTPFLQAGAGGVRNTIATGLVDLVSTSPAFHVGGGLDIALSPGLGLRFQARDYISKFDAQEAIFVDLVDGATGHTLAFTAGLRLSF